jgi:hypothetical protein
MTGRRPTPEREAPTPEQEAVVAAFAAGDHLVVQAGAGTGKTTTPRLLGLAADSSTPPQVGPLHCLQGAGKK